MNGLGMAVDSIVAKSLFKFFVYPLDDSLT